MNEDETRAELIDPKLKACGWGVIEGSKVFRNHPITAGKIQTGGRRVKTFGLIMYCLTKELNWQ